ncbi:hypothetical protein Mpet_2439 [Methanolacinia petrolearia DSM 11571]|uniref:Carbohydrate-binding domain-containing protein n=2 Tax=Methanolacinia TaxID=230355 RepID=E1REE2_METP4|nr:hypothetical protein Mpet_2439 [Methanolacinia petrolearia DSM 11571]
MNCGEKMQIKLSGLSFIFGLLFFCGVCIAPSCAATEYILSQDTQEMYKNGINHTGPDEAVIIVRDDFTISAVNCSGIESEGSITIKSDTGKILKITVSGSGKTTYGIKGSSVDITGGNIDLRAGGESTDITCGIYSSEGQISISGGTVSATADSSTSHKNKALYAIESVIISGGSVTASAVGGANSFGIDGDGDNGEGGVLISGGVVEVSATGAGTRNFGVDSRFGKVVFSGDSVITIYEDESGENQNYVFNSNVTSITGDEAVVFAGEGSAYKLQKNAVLAQDFALIPGKPFEIPEGLTLAVEKGVDFSTDGAEFQYETKYTNKKGQTVYTSAPVDPDSVATPLSVFGILAGIMAAFGITRRK